MVISPWDRRVNLPVVSIPGNLVFSVLLSCRGLGKVQVAGDRPGRLTSSSIPRLVTRFHEGRIPAEPDRRLTGAGTAIDEASTLTSIKA